MVQPQAALMAQRMSRHPPGQCFQRACFRISEAQAPLWIACFWPGALPPRRYRTATAARYAPPPSRGLSGIRPDTPDAISHAPGDAACQAPENAFCLFQAPSDAQNSPKTLRSASPATTKPSKTSLRATHGYQPTRLYHPQTPHHIPFTSYILMIPGNMLLPRKTA